MVVPAGFDSRTYSIGTLQNISIIKEPKIIHRNLVIIFTDEILGWYQNDLAFHKKLVYSFIPNIEPLCETFFARFQPNRFSLLVKLKQFEYARKKRNDEKSAVKYVQNVLIITNQLKYSLIDGFQHIYDCFHVNLKINLIKPFLEITDIKFYM